MVVVHTTGAIRLQAKADNRVLYSQVFSVEEALAQRSPKYKR